MDQEHSVAERLSCNKLFPRKCIDPGEEEIAEDPRRRDLFRLWLELIYLIAVVAVIVLEVTLKVT